MSDTKPAVDPAQRAAGIVMAFLGILIVVLVITFMHSTGKAPASKSAAVVVHKPKATYSATITDYVAANPADLKFYATVKNTGDAAGTPDCTVKAQDDSSSYHGFDTFTLKTVQPGASFDWQGDLTITGQGAPYVTKVTVSC